MVLLRDVGGILFVQSQPSCLSSSPSRLAQWSTLPFRQPTCSPVSWNQLHATYIHGIKWGCLMVWGKIRESESQQLLRIASSYGSWFEPSVFCHWAMTTRHPPARDLTIICLCCFSLCSVLPHNIKHVFMSSWGRMWQDVLILAEMMSVHIHSHSLDAVHGYDVVNHVCRPGFLLPLQKLSILRHPYLGMVHVSYLPVVSYPMLCT